MRRFGKYDVVEKIGEGGFGVVYEGFDPGIRRRVAIKTCTSEDPAARARFQREAEIAGNLQHRNLTVLYDAGEQDGVPYLVQELLTGEDLDRKIQRGDELSFATKLLYLVEIARGLDYAHSQGIVHRDVKPANVRVLDDGMVKIIDFGTASSEADSDNLTSTGQTVGTAAYLAPEQIWGAPVDQRADIHAFGVLAYELLTGKRAFLGNDPTEVMRRVLEDKPAQVHQSWPACPPALEALVVRCTAKDPELRYQNLSEVVRELEALNRAPDPNVLKEPVEEGAGPTTAIEMASLQPPLLDPRETPVPGFAQQALDKPRSPPAGVRRTRPPAIASGPPTHSTQVARAVRPARISGLAYLIILGAMALLGAGGALWFQRGGGRQAVGQWIQSLSQAAAWPDAGGGAEGGDPATSGGTSNEAATTPPSGSETASASPADGGPSSADFATLIVQPGWSPDIELSISNQPAILLDSEKRFRLEPEVDHYLELSLSQGEYRIRVPSRISLGAGEERTIQAEVPRPAGLTVRTASRAPRVFVRVDGKALGWTPIEGRPFGPGSYRVEAWSSASTQGQPLQSEQIELRPRFQTSITFDTRKTLDPVVTESAFRR